MLRQILGYRRIGTLGHFAMVQALTDKVRKLYHSIGRFSLAARVLHMIYGMAFCFSLEDVQGLHSLRFLPAVICFRDGTLRTIEQNRVLTGQRHAAAGRPAVKVGEGIV